MNRQSDRNAVRFISRSPGDENYYRNSSLPFYPVPVIQKHKKDRSPVQTRVEMIDLTMVRPQRTGVIIYTVYDGILYFGLGVDARTHDLTDFGGGAMYKMDKDAITAALREFQEETLEIFQPLQYDEVKSCPVVYDSANLIMFLHLAVNPDKVSETFQQRYQQVFDSDNYHPEMCGIVWLTWKEFQRVTTEKGIMFSRVQKFLAKAGQLATLL
jgi:hypothetical protein